MTIITINRPTAGFGSNFLQAIDWLWYSQNTKTSTYIGWYNWPDDSYNFFNDLFVQKQIAIPPFYIPNAYYTSDQLSNPNIDEIRYNDLPLYKKYNRFFLNVPGIYHEQDFKTVLRFFHSIYKNNLSLQPTYSLPKLNYTLGVHIRMSGLYFLHTGPSTPLHTILPEDEFYSRNLQQIKAKYESGKYEKIYLGCDDKKFFDICINEFKDKIIYQNYDRNLYHNCQNRYTEHSPNIGESQRPPLAVEAHNSLIDILNLASCDDFLGCISNFTFTVLVFNPYSNFELFDTVRHLYTS
jgi:hypothetical protein